MGGRNKIVSDFAGQYSIETVDFWCNDNRVLSLSGKARIVLFYLGLFALKERREVLPSHYNSATICKRSAIDLRGGDMLLQQIAAKCLIDFTTDGRIIVCGARKRRPNLTFKDDAHIEGINGYISDKAVSSKQEAIKGNPEYAAEGGNSVPPKKTLKPIQLDGRWVVREVGVV